MANTVPLMADSHSYLQRDLDDLPSDQGFGTRSQPFHVESQSQITTENADEESQIAPDEDVGE